MTDTLTESATERDEWLQRRRTGIGASDVAGIIGLSPWASPYSVWADKTGLTSDTEPTDVMQIGLLAEHVIAPMYTARTGRTLHGVQLECANAEHLWQKCTLDAFEGDTDDLTAADALVEMKWTGESVKAWDEEIPLHYRCQAAWQSIVTGIEQVRFAVIHSAFGRHQFAIYDYTPDPDDKAMIERACSEFWHEHVLTGIAPDVDHSTATTDAITEAWGRIPDADDVMYADDDLSLQETVRALDRARRDRLAAQDNEKQISNLLKARMQDCTELVVDGEPICSWRPQQTNRLDTTALRKAHPDIADQFTTSTTSRVLRTHKTKGRK